MVECRGTFAHAGGHVEGVGSVPQPRTSVAPNDEALSDEISLPHRHSSTGASSSSQEVTTLVTEPPNS